MKIQKLETYTSRYVSFVKVTTDDGMSGIGQMSTYHADITAQVFHRQIAPWVLGKSIEDAHHGGDARLVFADLAALVTEREHKFPGSYIYRALAGLDTALWDLVATAAELPVTALIGGEAGPLRAYASSMKRDISPADEAARFCQLRDDKGFDAFKFRVGAECGRGQDEWPGRTEEIIPTVTAALGDGIVKLVDANSCFGVARAIEVGHMLQDHGVTHYEEPCPYWHPDDTLQVTNALDIDVTGGEQDCDMRVWKDMIDRRIVNIVQPDVMYMGGITPWLQVADMAKQAGLICTPHAANLSLVTICTMHALKAIANAGAYLELSIEGADYYPWQEGLFRGDPFKVTDGHVTISEAPGWGVEVNPDWLAAADYAVSEFEG